MVAAVALSEYVFSASQIQTYLECPRKWGWQYVDGIKSPPNRYAQFGLELHAYAEKYLRDFIAPNGLDPAGAALVAGIEHLPAPTTLNTPGLEVEQEFQLTVSGIKYRGFIDATWPANEQGIPVVLDHKSTSDLKWAKTEEELLENVQAMLYAKQTMHRHRTDRVELRWVYYARKRPQSKCVSLVVFQPHVDDQIRRINEVAREILEIKQDSGLTARDLPPDVTACEAYGGCPHKDRCNLSPVERMNSFMATKSIKELREELAAKRAKAEKAGKPEAAPKAKSEAAPAPEPSTKVTTPPPVKQTLAEKMAARRAAAAQGVNPPADEPETPPKAITVPPAPPAPPPFTRRGPGRPPGSKNKSTRPPAMPDAADMPGMGSPPVPREMKETVAGKTAEGSGYWLFVNSSPDPGTKLRVIRFSQIFTEVSAFIQAQHSKPHYLAIQYEGRAVYATYLDQYLDEKNYGPSFAITVDVRSPEGSDGLSVLERYAGEIVRGG